MDIHAIIGTIESCFSSLVSAISYIVAGIVVVMIICFAVAAYELSQKHRPLYRKLRKGAIRVNGQLAQRLRDVIRRRAIYDFESRFEMYRDRKGNDRPEFIQYFSDISREWWPFIFEEYTDVENDITVYFTNPMFVEWLKDCDTAYQLDDFEKAVWRYMKVIDKQRQAAIEEEYAEYERALQERQSKIDQEDEQIRQGIVKSIAAVKRRKEKAVTKAVIVDRYNRCVQDIHANEDHGLLPDRPQSIPIALYRYLYGARIYGNQQIHRMMDDAKWDSLSAKGCYIIFNTFNGKHFVGKSENIYADLKLCLHGQGVGDQMPFRKDLLVGHMMLVKFVVLSESGISDLNVLHEALCRSYKSFDPIGYNKVTC